MNSDLSFEHPLAFLIILLFILCSKFCKAKSEALIFPHVDIFLKTKGRKSLWLFLLKWATIIFATIALASLVKKDSIEINKKNGYSIVLALDVSGSMRYGFDRKLPGIGGKNKFEITQEMAQSFIQKRVNDNIGIVVFGNFAYVASPLTYDKNILKQILNSIYVTMAGSKFTVISDALFQSANLFKTSKSKSKIIILLTDGKSRGDRVPLDASIRLSQEFKIKVYTIGIGKTGQYNKEYLKIIADKTGGKFFAASNPNTLKLIYEKIDKLQKSEIKSPKYIKKSYYYEYPLFLAFLSLLFYIFLLNKRALL